MSMKRSQAALSRTNEVFYYENYIDWQKLRIVDKGEMENVIAVIGCDGSGKTRLVKELVEILSKERPTQRLYMGLVSGETGDKIKDLPIIGVQLERYLAAKVRRAQDMKKKVPGAFTASVMYLFSLWRTRQMRLLKLRANSGTLILAERYPQAEMAGFHYDGPGIAVERSSNRFVQWLAKREQLIYDQMVKNKPQFIIRLTIDAETAYNRKPDHPISELRDKIKNMPLINYNDSEIIEIDSRLPYEEVLTKALEIIREGSRQG